MTDREAQKIPPVMLLAAGRGSRLRPLTDHTPKPLLDLAGKPLIDRQLAQLAAAGATRVVVNTFHLADRLEAHLQRYLHHGAGRTKTAAAPAATLDLQISREPALLETGGGILYARAHLPAEQIWILNGDVLMNAPLMSFPRTLPADQDLHMLLRPTPAYRDHGDFDMVDGRITGRGESYVYCCLALLSVPALERYARTLPASEQTPLAFSLQGFLFDRTAAGRAGGTLHDGYWFDIGTREQLDEANAYLAAAP